MLLDEQKLTDENAREESGLHAGALHAAGWAFILSDSTAFLLTAEPQFAMERSLQRKVVAAGRRQRTIVAQQMVSKCNTV